MDKIRRESLVEALDSCVRMTEKVDGLIETIEPKTQEVKKTESPKDQKMNEVVVILTAISLFALLSFMIEIIFYDL